jgi:hypothetical protein
MRARRRRGLLSCRQAQPLAQQRDLIDGVANAPARVVVATLHCGLLVQVSQAIEDVVAQRDGRIFLSLCHELCLPLQVVDIGEPGPSAEPATAARKDLSQV